MKKTAMLLLSLALVLCPLFALAQGNDQRL